MSETAILQHRAERLQPFDVSGRTVKWGSLEMLLMNTGRLQSCNSYVSIQEMSRKLVSKRRHEHPKTEHGPHSSQLVNCVLLCIVCVDCVVLCTACVKICTVLVPPAVNPIAVKCVIYIVSYNIVSYHIYYIYIYRIV